MARPKQKKARRDTNQPAENFPKVSVILTSYNHANFVAAAIESVLNQTFTDFELLIVDDGSVDSSRDVIKTFDDPRIKFFLYETNRGPAEAVGDALKSARGKYLAAHHSDDLWAPDKLAKQVAFLDENPNCAACFTWVDFVDELGNPQQLSDGEFYQKIFEQPNRTRAEWLNYFFHNANCLCHPSALVLRELYEKIFLNVLHGFWQLPDYLMWIRLCFRADIFILPERLTKFRFRGERQENMSAKTFEKSVRGELEFFFVAREFLTHFKDDKFFLEVFPDAEKFLVDGQINRRFAFAKICLEKNKPAFNLVGLDLLKNLLSSTADAAQIKNLYGYDEKSFLRDGGNFDVFNLGGKSDVLHAEIFSSDGDKFTRAAEKNILLDAAGKFYGRFDFNLDSPAKYLRFDPDKNFISVKLNRVLLNGAPCEIFSSNAGETVDGFSRFWTSDPQIFFDVDGLSGRVTLEIFGEREENFPAVLEQTIQKFSTDNAELNAKNEDLHRQNDGLRAYNEELHRRNDELNRRNEELNARNEELNQRNEELNRRNGELNRRNEELQGQKNHLEQVNAAILNSKSWKITEPLRAVGRLLK